MIQDYLELHSSGDVSYARIDSELVEGHEKLTGTKLRPLAPELVEEMRLYHHHYKHIDGAVQRKSPAELEADYLLRVPPKPEGPSEMQQMLDLQKQLLQAIHDLPGNLMKAFE